MQTLDCGHPISEHSPITTGYGSDDNGKTFCYDCCAEQDRAFMRANGRISLYLTVPQDCLGFRRMVGQSWGSVRSDTARLTEAASYVSNWPGSLKLACFVRKGRHNIAGTRYDVWFEFEGTSWHGTCYGENSQICRCKRLKAA